MLNNIPNPKQKVAWLFSKIPGFTQSSTLQMIYSGDINGWSFLDFHTACDNKGSTLLLAQSSNGRVFGGFANTSWESGEFGDYAPDASAFLFSMDGEGAIFKPQDSKQAVIHNKYSGPDFGGGALVFGLEPMNGQKKATSQYNDKDWNYYIPAADGKNPLTGETTSSFTCTKLEVYKVIF